MKTPKTDQENWDMLVASEREVDRREMKLSATLVRIAKGVRNESDAREIIALPSHTPTPATREVALLKAWMVS